MPVVRTDGLSVSRSVGHVISKSREARAWSSAITVWKQFITWHKLYLRWLWHAAQKRTFRSALLTLKIWQYHDPGVTKPVLCPFLNQWIIRTFGFWCESVGPSWVWFASDKSKCDRVVRSKTSMTDASFRNVLTEQWSLHNFDSKSNGLRCDFSTNKPKSM